ncbi:hypothetical protein MZM54_04850 [[Brevibacterium] frigoritolerans]|nr:hypothetical protein [Peribacillus frigoritolerans]
MIKNLCKQFVKEEDGGLVEYLILIAIAAVAAALLFPKLRTNLASWFSEMTTNANQGITGNTTIGSGDGAGKAGGTTAESGVTW